MVQLFQRISNQQAYFGGRDDREDHVGRTYGRAGERKEVGELNGGGPGQETWQQQLDVVAAQQAQQAERAARVEQDRFTSLRAGARRSTVARIKVAPP